MLSNNQPSNILNDALRSRGHACINRLFHIAGIGEAPDALTLRFLALQWNFPRQFGITHQSSRNVNKIKVILAGTERGPFSEEMTRLYLEQGILLPTDQARTGEDSNWEPVEAVLEKLSLQRPTERFVRKKRKTSSAKQRAKQRKIMMVSSYIALAVIVALAFIFQDFVMNVYNLINYTLFEQWVRFFE